MYNKTMLISRKRIFFYLKRYWWIIVVALVVGVSGGVYNITNREAQTVEYEGRLESKVLVLVGEDEKISVSTLIGDCKVLLDSKELEQQLDVMENQEKSSNIEIKEIELSNCFTLGVTSKTEKSAEITSEYVMDYLIEKVEEYYPQSRLIILETNWKLVEEEAASPIYLSDLFIIAFPPVVTLLILYFIMVSDKRVLTCVEANSIIGAKKSIIFGEVEHSWISWQLEKDKDNISLISSGEEETSTITEKSAKMQELDVKELEKCRQKRMWIFISPENVDRDMLFRFRSLLEICDYTPELLVWVE